MSVKAVAWVLDDLQGLKPGPTLVMLALADFADERNSCFPGQATIAARARCSKRSVVKYLQELEELGLITVEGRFFSNGGSSIRRSSNRYVLHVGRSFGLDDAKSAHSRKAAAQNECAKSAPSTLESADLPLSKVQPVALIEPPVIEPPSPLPPVSTSGGGAGSLVGEGDFSPMVGDRLGAGAPADGGSRFGFAFDAVAQPPVGEGVSPASSVSGVGADRRLCDEVVPPGLGRVPDSAVGEIAGLIRQRLDAGWRRDQIREALGFRRVPDRIHSVAGLVRARFRDDVPAVPPSGPVAGVSAGGFEWRTAAGRRVKRYEVDWSRVLVAHRRALAAGETVTEHRAEFLWELTGGVVDDFLI